MPDIFVERLMRLLYGKPWEALTEVIRAHYKVEERPAEPYYIGTSRSRRSICRSPKNKEGTENREL